jgi:hypothetical protein
MAAEGLVVETACRVLEVSVSGFYAWKTRPLSARAVRHAWLTDLIRQAHTDSRGVYGARRVHAELTLGFGVTVGHDAVEMLMRRAGLVGLTGRPKFRKIVNVATSSDLVGRDFARSHHDDCWNPSPAKARCIARSCSTRGLAASWAGPSTRHRRPRW